LQQPQRVVAGLSGEIGKHEDVRKVRAAIFFRKVDKQRPNGAVSHQGQHFPVEKQTDQVNGPQPQKPPHYFEKEHFTVLQFLMLLEENVGEEEATGHQPDIHPVKTSINGIILRLRVKRCGGGEVGDSSQIGQCYSCQGNCFHS